jgi:hypothetical protein
VVITVYFYEDLTLREVGRALNLTEGIPQILYRALAKLRETLTESIQFMGSRRTDSPAPSRSPDTLVLTSARL